MLLFALIDYLAMNLTLLKAKLEDFGQLPEESWQMLRDSLQANTFRAGDFLLSEGQVCQSIFFINQGYCRRFHRTEGDEISTQFYFEQEFATNTKSLVAGTPSEYFIQASQEVEAIIFDKATLLGLYQRSVAIESVGRKLLEQLLIQQEEHAHIFKLFNPKERYEYLLKHHPAIIQRVPLRHIASYLGIARETLSRIRSRKT